MIKIKNIFPTNQEEINLIKFINTYQYLSSKDLKYFFSTTYYPKRITRLIKNDILRKYKNYIVLGKNGYNFMKILNIPTKELRYQEKYSNRLKYISHLAAVMQSKFITFLPSFLIKDKSFTESSRKFIGIISIFGTKYLTYYITNEHTKKYINSIIYDLQKEVQHKNILILVDNLSKIDLMDFSFGFHSLIICENTDENLNKLKYIHQINWRKIINSTFKENLHISEFNFCDYTNSSSKYVACFYFIDTEKINRIKTFMQNNIDKKVDIICDESIIKQLGQELALCNFNLVNISNFIEKEIRLYD